MICAKCGSTNDPNDKFCRLCHADLEVPPEVGGEVKSSVGATRESKHNVCQENLINGRFKIIKVLGRGGMGEIYLAEDNKLQRKVAIKSIGDNAAHDCDSKARFLREARAASQLDHPNICTIYEIASENDSEYIIMQYVDGVTLDQLQKLKPLTTSHIIDIALEISDGMLDAHARNIVHRDLKPGNIMIDKSGKVKILDFGLAKICSGSKMNGESSHTQADLTEKGVVMGTVAYMSPEQAKGLELDGRSDIFSFGVLLYELLERKNPFADKENIVTLYNILNKQVKLNPDIPLALQKIVYQALQKDREKRQHDFSEIKNSLTLIRESLVQNKIERNKIITEIINLPDQDPLLKNAGQKEKTSDNENLSEMVQHLKQLKASTEKLSSSKSRSIGLRLAVVIPFLIIMALGLGHFFKSRTEPIEKKDAFCNILLFPLKNQSSDKDIAEKINFLLQESLNQFAGFKVIDEKTIPALFGGKMGAESQLADLKEKLNIRYHLKIKLSNVADKYNIEADFNKIGAGKTHAPFFIPGKGKNSLLTDQVDNLTRRIQQIALASSRGDEQPFCELAVMYGSDWQFFESFFQGLSHWTKKQFGPAREKLLRASGPAGPPLASFYLALLSDYTGSGAEAQKYLQQLTPKLNQLSRPWQLKIKALQAKFNFNFHEQITHLQELKSFFPYHKEVYYELGEAYFRCGNAQQAIPEFRAALALDSNYPDALNHLGYCYSYLGSHLQAIECFENYHTIDRTANSFDSLGDGYFYKGDYIQAENNKIYAASLDNTMDWPYLAIADIHILKANDQEAEKNLQTYEAMATYPKAKADAIAKRAFIHYRNSDYIGARNLLDQAIHEHDSTLISDTSGEYHWLKGLAAIALTDLAGARREWLWLQACKEKYKLSPINFHANLKYELHLQALISEKEKNIERAGQTFQELLSMKTQLSFWITQYHYQFFLTEYAKFLLRQKNFNAAAAAIQECLEFNPDYPPALWAQYSLFKQTRNPASRGVLQKIAAIYGPGERTSLWRRRLAIESR